MATAVVVASNKRFGIGHGCAQVEDTSYRYRVLECAWIQRYEGWSGMRKGGSAAECKFECLLEKEASEDHEIVSVSILRLHDHGRSQDCTVHVLCAW